MHQLARDEIANSVRLELSQENVGRSHCPATSQRSTAGRLLFKELVATYLHPSLALGAIQRVGAFVASMIRGFSKELFEQISDCRGLLLLERPGNTGCRRV